MVRFRRVVAGTDINHWWDDGANAIAFSRGSKGFVAINREATTIDTTVATGMAPGTYCDLITGGVNGPACAGMTLVVDSTGAVRVSLPTNSGVAIDVETLLP
jgi:alpha-amylase